MDIRKLQRAIVDGLEDVKAQDIRVYNTEHLSPLFERVIIASGTSNRQTKALAASVRDSVRQRGMEVLRTEGEDNGEWIIVDCGAAVAHIMQPNFRQYYHLEEIWGEKPVRLKVDTGSRKLAKASEPEEDVAPHEPALRKRAVAKASAPAKKAASEKKPVTAKRVAEASKATTAKKSAPGRKSAASAGVASARKTTTGAAKKPGAARKKPAVSGSTARPRTKT